MGFNEYQPTSRVVSYSQDLERRMTGYQKILLVLCDAHAKATLTNEELENEYSRLSFEDKCLYLYEKHIKTA